MDGFIINPQVDEFLPLGSLKIFKSTSGRVVTRPPLEEFILKIT